MNCIRLPWELLTSDFPQIGNDFYKKVNNCKSTANNLSYTLLANLLNSNMVIKSQMIQPISYKWTRKKGEI
jgi:hypothetical protein